MESSELSKIQAFTFKATEEIFRDGVIIRVALTAHALDEIGIFESVSKAERSVLDTAIGVKNQAGSGFLAADGHEKSFEHQVGIDP